MVRRALPAREARHPVPCIVRSCSAEWLHPAGEFTDHPHRRAGAIGPRRISRELFVRDIRSSLQRAPRWLDEVDAPPPSPTPARHPIPRRRRVKASGRRGWPSAWVVVHGASGHQELTRRQIGLRAVQAGRRPTPEARKGVGVPGHPRPPSGLGSSTSPTVTVSSVGVAPKPPKREITVRPACPGCWGRIRTAPRRTPARGSAACAGEARRTRMVPRPPACSQHCSN